MSASDSYETFAYRGHPFPQTHPDRLALLARLHGIDAADPDRCRVLELGCGDGANLVAIAAASPGVRALGIDAAAGGLERGRALASALDLGNVELRAADLRAPGGLGTFDYAIAHGVWSWIDDDVREALLACLGATLAPGGVAYVSYTAMPGGRLRELGRDLALRSGGTAGSPAERAGRARAGLARLEPWVRGRDDPYAHVVEQELARIGGRTDAVLAHDELAPLWSATWLGDFAAAAARHGLCFLCEAEPAELRGDWLPAGAEPWLDGLAGEDAVARGELADIVTGRAFRQTLLCRAEHAPERLSPAGVHRLLIGDARTPFADWANGRAEPEAEALAGLRSGDLELHAARARYAAAPGERPEAFALARLQAAEGPDVTNLRHEHLRLEDPYSRLLVTALDGTRDRATLAAHLAAELERRQLAPQRGAALLERVTGGLERSLVTLAALGLLRRLDQ